MLYHVIPLFGPLCQAKSSLKTQGHLLVMLHLQLHLVPLQLLTSQLRHHGHHWVLHPKQLWMGPNIGKIPLKTGWIDIPLYHLYTPKILQIWSLPGALRMWSDQETVKSLIECIYFGDSRLPAAVLMLILWRGCRNVPLSNSAKHFKQLVKQPPSGDLKIPKMSKWETFITPAAELVYLMSQNAGYAMVLPQLSGENDAKD